MKYSYLLVGSCVFLSGCFGDYFTYWDSNHLLPHIKEGTGVQLTGNLFILPDKRVLDEVNRMIDHAKKRIWIETYLWTEKSILESVIRAKNRGLDVQVLLERNVYGTPRINDDVIAELKMQGIPFHYTNDDYTFTHMKLWMIDDTWCMSTGNWAQSSFLKNREFIFCSQDGSILTSFEEIFRADSRGIVPLFLSGGMDNRMGLAPWNLRESLVEALDSAKSEIIIYNQSIADQKILDTLFTLRKSGIHIELCQSSTSESGSDYHNIPLYFSTKPYLHAKIVMIDSKILLISSANITENALDRNREVLIKIENSEDTIKKIKNLYNNDCKEQY